MELPISVMIVLFVAVAVSIGIIGFAGSNITMGRQRVDDLGNIGGVPMEIDDYIVTVATISERVVESLSEQCVREMLPRGQLTTTTCFVVSGTDIDISINNIDGESFEVMDTDWEYQVVGIDANTQTVFIRYAPSLGKIIIES